MPVNVFYTRDFVDVNLSCLVQSLQPKRITSVVLYVCALQK